MSHAIAAMATAAALLMGGAGVAVLPAPAAASSAIVGQPANHQPDRPYQVHVRLLDENGTVRTLFPQSTGATVEVTVSRTDSGASESPSDEFYVGISVKWPSTILGPRVPGAEHWPPSDRCAFWLKGVGWPVDQRDTLVNPAGASGTVAARSGDECFVAGLASRTASATVRFALPIPHRLDGDPLAGDVAVAVTRADWWGAEDDTPDPPTPLVEGHPALGSDAARIVEGGVAYMTTTSLDRDTSWAHGKPITATFVITRSVEDPHWDPPRLITDADTHVDIAWPEFLPAPAISGCDVLTRHDVQDHADCGVHHLITPGGARTITAVFPVSDATPGSGPIQVNGAPGTVVIASPPPSSPPPGILRLAPVPIVSAASPAVTGMLLVGSTARAVSGITWAATSDGPSPPPVMPPEWIVGSSARVTIIEEPLTTSVDLSSDKGWPNGDPVTATIGLHHDPGTREFVNGEATLMVTWPAFLTLMHPGDRPTQCGTYVVHEANHNATCTLTGFDQPDTNLSFDLEFSMPGDSSDPAAEGPIAVTGIALTTDVEGDHLDLDPTLIVPSSAAFTVVANAFPIDVILDRSVSTPGGVRLHASVHVAWAKALDAEGSQEVGVRLDWPDFLIPVDPPGVSGCATPVVDKVCGLQFSQVGDERTIDMWFDMPSGKVGSGYISAVGTQICPSFSHCTGVPPQWIGSDKQRFDLVQPQLAVAVALDHGTGWTGGKPITATITVTRTDPGPGHLDGLTAVLRTTTPALFPPVSLAGCDQVAGADCTLSGFDDPTSKRTFTVTLGMPAVENPAPVPFVPSQFPLSGDVRIDPVALSYLAVPAAPLPPPPPTETPSPSPSPSVTPTPTPSKTLTTVPGSYVYTTPISDGVPSTPAPSPSPTPSETPPPPTPVAQQLPPAWITGGSASLTVLQPKVTVVPSIIRPGEVAIVVVSDVPAGATVALRWVEPPDVFPYPPMVAASPSVFSLELLQNTTIGQKQLTILRRESLGKRSLELSSPDGSFGVVLPARPVLIVPRSTTPGELVGRGG